VNPLPSTLLVVSDRHQARAPLIDTLAAIVAAGARWAWLREKDLDHAERLALARAIARILRPVGGKLSIGGDAELAAEAGADGVHLSHVAEIAPARRLLGRAAMIGVSAHRPDELRAAREAGADYATLSPIFASASKPGYGPALGVAAISDAARHGLPVIALAGITPERAALCREAGAAGVAVMGELMRAQDPRPLVRALL
jgi:thiamine-phosphate pyrophosphorylase